MADSVAPRAEPIMAHMNKDHKDSMAAIVLQRVPSLRRPPTSVRMTAIDSKGYTLEYKLVTDLLRNPKGTKHDLRVPFIPPVKAASDVRARLVDMSIEAVDKLPRSYPITYSVPRDLFVSVLIFGLLFGAGVPGLSTSVGAKVGLQGLGSSADRILSQLVSKVPGGANSAWFLAKWLALAHTAEATAMTAFVLYRGGSPLTTLKWVITHFFVGFPSYFNFQKLNPPAPARKGAKQH